MFDVHTVMFHFTLLVVWFLLECYRCHANWYNYKSF